MPSQAGYPGIACSNRIEKTDRSADKLQCIDYTFQQRALECCLGGMKKSFRPAQASGMQGEEHEESPPQKGVASVIERWESRNISAEALQHMRGSALRSSWTSEDSASDAQEVSSVRVSMAPLTPSLCLRDRVASRLMTQDARPADPFLAC